MDESKNRLYSSIPAEPLDSDFPERETLESILSEEIHSQFTKEIHDEISETLEDFRATIIKRVKNNTLKKIHQEVFSKEDQIVDNISQSIVDYYHENLLKFLKKQTKSLPPVRSSVVSLEEQRALQGEEEEMNAYLGLSSSHSYNDNDYAKRQEQDFSSADVSSYRQKRSMQKRFIRTLSSYSIVLGIFSTVFLYFVSPFVFFSSSNLFLSFCVAIVTVAFCSEKETRYFRTRGLFLSLERKKLNFRSVLFFLYFLVFSIIFGFLFLTDYNYHSMDLHIHPSSLIFWWTSMTNRFFGFLQIGLSPSVLLLIQHVVLGLALVFSFLVITKIFIKQQVDSL